MIKVEIPNTIGIGAGENSDTLKGIALMAEKMQSEGLTFKMTFASTNVKEGFLEHFVGYYDGKHEEFGDIVVVRGD